MLRPKFLILAVTILSFVACQNETSKDNIELEKEIRFTEIKRPYTTISPTIHSLLKAEKETFQAKIENLWLNVQKSGLPHIENDILDPDYKYITFLYKAENNHTEISFEVKGIYSDYRLGDMALRKLGNTNFHYRCYKVPADICFSYRFIIKNTLTGKVHKEIDKFNTDRIPTGEIHDYTFSVLDLKKEESNLNIKKHSISGSQIDTLKYTDKIVNKERNIYVYLPPGYDKNRQKAYPVIYLFDAFMYLNRIEVPNILDNLIAKNKAEPMIAVFFATYRSTRGVILPLNTDFKDEFITDFLPLIREQYNVSTEIDENIIGGMSYGGLAACYTAFYHPDIFGKVLSQSGSFWRDKELESIKSEWIRSDWLINKFINEEKKDIKIFLDWGLQENQVLGSNRRLVRVLGNKKYEYKYIEFNGWHDWSNSRKTFSKGLLYLLE
ncbi:MAG: esterase family protein [Bacteroidales bacterium]|nr:esterase family protein [Bacteroidales bacterium]